MSDLVNDYMVICVLTQKRSLIAVPGQKSLPENLVRLQLSKCRYTPWEGYMLVGYDVTTDACSYWGMHQWPHLSRTARLTVHYLPRIHGHLAIHANASVRKYPKLIDFLNSPVGVGDMSPRSFSTIFNFVSIMV